MAHTASNRLGYKSTRFTGFQYGLVVFVFFTARLFLLSSGRESFSYWITTPYVITYESGFIARALVGSAVALFTDYLTLRAFKILITCVALALIGLTAWLLGKTAARAQPESKDAATVFTALFLCAPISMTYLLEAHFGRLEAFLLIFTLLALVCMKKPGLEWAVPVLCVLALATHPGYIVTYMPGLAVPLLYEVYRRHGSRKSVAVFTSACVVMIGLFLYFQLFSRGALGYASAEEMGRALSRHSEMKVGTPMLYLEYFAPFPGWVTDYILPLVKSIALPVGTVIVITSLPLMVLFALIWKNSIRGTKDKFLKLIYVICLLSPLVFAGAAVFGIDWDRQWAPVINCQFIFVFYFLFSGEESLTQALKKTGAFLGRHTLLTLSILIFSAMMMFSNNGLLSFNFFDKSVYDRFFASALSDYDYLLG